MVAPAKSDRRYSYADYLEWDDEARWELIEGAAWAMTPAPTWRHQEVLGNLYYQLRQRLEGGGCVVAAAPLDVRLAPAEADDTEVLTVLQPDLVIVCDPTKIDTRGVRGAPTVVVEVLSPSGSLRDAVVKRAAYERAGVLEYWLVDPDSERVVILALEEGRYGEPRSFARGDTLVSERLPGIRLDVEKLFASSLEGQPPPAE